MSTPTDQDLDAAVAVLLRIGVSLSAVVVVIGGVLMHAHWLDRVPDYTHFEAGASSLRSLSGIAYAATHLDPQSVIACGLLLLIATPVARVLLCVIGFARQRDWLYVAVSTFVLVVLLISFASAGR